MIDVVAATFGPVARSQLPPLDSSTERWPLREAPKAHSPWDWEVSSRDPPLSQIYVHSGYRLT